MEGSVQDSVENELKTKKTCSGKPNGRHNCDGRYSVSISVTGVMMKITKVTVTGS